MPEEDIELKVSSFFAKVKDPVLASPTLSFPDGVRITKLYPSPLPDVFKGDQLVLVGRFSGAGRGPVTLAGSVNGSPRRFDFNASFAGQRTENEFISRLWATRRVGYLLDEIRLRGETAELRDEVTALARQHGIVTPYTAYLIHEDEQRRGIPLAQQSLPAFSSNAGMRETGRAAYRALQDNVSGAGAVAAARYGLAQKSANQAGVALDFARVEAGRAVLSAAPAMAPEIRSFGGAAPSASFAAPSTAVEQVVQIDQQSRYVGGRTFFQNGNQWVDSEVQKQAKAKRTRLQFGTPEYFNFAAAHADARPWLALGSNVQFVLGDTVYEVVE